MTRRPARSGARRAGRWRRAPGPRARAWQRSSTTAARSTGRRVRCARRTGRRAGAPPAGGACGSRCAPRWRDPLVNRREPPRRAGRHHGRQGLGDDQRLDELVRGDGRKGRERRLLRSSSSTRAARRAVSAPASPTCCLRRDRTSPRFETSRTAIWPFRSAGLMPAFFLRDEFAERPVRQRAQDSPYAPDIRQSSVAP